MSFPFFRILQITVGAGWLLGFSGCESVPSVRSVRAVTHLESIAPADQDLYLTDRASRIHTSSRMLPEAQQGVEYSVNWNGRTVDLVQFEYRQTDAPDKISAQDFHNSKHQYSTTFWIRGTDYAKGGSVSAWRVTLWHDGELLAEQHSMLW